MNEGEDPERTEPNSGKSRSEEHLTLRLLVAAVTCNAREELDGLTKSPLREDVRDRVATLYQKREAGGVSKADQGK
jgi:hypothetical protein